jgi:hypothetical protein
MKVDGESVEIDASLDPQCQGSHAIIRIARPWGFQVFSMA